MILHYMQFEFVVREKVKYRLLCKVLISHFDFNLIYLGTRKHNCKKLHDILQQPYFNFTGKKMYYHVQRRDFLTFVFMSNIMIIMYVLKLFTGVCRRTVLCLVSPVWKSSQSIMPLHPHTWLQMTLKKTSQTGTSCYESECVISGGIVVTQSSCTDWYKFVNQAMKRQCENL